MHLTGGQDLDPHRWEFLRASAENSEYFKAKKKKPVGTDRRHSSALVVENTSRHPKVTQTDADHLSPSLIWACCKTKDLSKGTWLHNELQKRGLAEKHYSDALVAMYAKCGDLQTAQALLDKHKSSSTSAWTSLIAGYARQGQGNDALRCFEQMRREGVSPNAVTYACLLKACGAVGALDMGKQIHDYVSNQGLLEHDAVLRTALVDMYAKCSALPQARSLLENISSRNVVTWNALISGYLQKGQGQQALECFEEMCSKGVQPDTVTYLCILKACASIGAINKGKQIHNEIFKQRLLEHDVVLGNALIDMYAKCGALPQARTVLENLPRRDVVSWNALITGYGQKAQGREASECFEQMQYEGITPDRVTYVCILKACSAVRALDKGKQIHKEVLKQGLLKRDPVLGTALVDMYAKCGALPQAKSVLKKLPFRDVISWTALIAGYAQNGKGVQALKCFTEMQSEGILPNEVTYVCILKACAELGAVDEGKQIHGKILEHGLLKHNILLGNSLVDMYCKCGALSQAEIVLKMLSSRNVVSWSTIIAGYAQKGQGQQALNCFNRMQEEGVFPDAATIHCLLNMCNHLGLVEKGQELFDNMEVMYGLKRDVESLTCIIDLLGRAGHLMRAVKLIQAMPFSANSSIWHCLLGACQKWADVNVGIWAFQHAIDIDECDEEAYNLMVNIFAAAGMQEKAKDIEAMRLKSRSWKLPRWPPGPSTIKEVCTVHG